MSPEEEAALKEGEEEATEEKSDDEKDKEQTPETPEVQEVKSAATEPPVEDKDKEVVSGEVPASPKEAVPPSYVATWSPTVKPEDIQAKLVELDAARKELKRKFDTSEIDFDEYEQQKEELAELKADIKADLKLARAADEFTRQNALQKAVDDQNRFMDLYQ
ncbi:MAG: hypothetical protein HQK55_08010, partial [Deltaproteobacteria bacterium]|nr:hypothetical protein [Deltaproteobacteria bacterium]